MEPCRPVFLFAHSMGALIAKPILVVMAKILSRVWPAFVLRTELDVEAISRDPEVVWRIAPTRSFLALRRPDGEGIDAVRRVRDNAHQITLPVLLIHGGADRLNAASGIAPYAERLSSPDETVQIYPEAFHEPHNEVDHATVVADVVAWIEDRLLARP